MNHECRRMIGKTYHSSRVDNVGGKVDLAEPNRFVMCCLDGRVISEHRYNDRGGAKHNTALDERVRERCARVVRMEETGRLRNDESH